ncbi:MAG: amidohydrolase [Candidatus Rokubacteria bacterium]|nr:amidohydrolase [Candidatus Rokubacteria bacterium]
MEIIDVRARPNTKEYMSLFEASPGIQMVFRKMGASMPASAPIDEFIRDMREAGISRIVCTGRDIETTGGWKVTNDYVASLMSQYPAHIIGVAGIDPLKGSGAVKETFRAVRELGLKGISIDPFAVGMYANDRRLYPVYELCAELDVPVFITIGPLPVAGPYLSFGSPMPIDEVATDFSRLKIVCSHGGWPFSREMVAITFRHDYVYFETSVYHFMPGAELCVEAANTCIPDRYLFATAFPFAPMKETVQRFRKLPFKPDVLEKVMYKNAADLFKLEPAAGTRSGRQLF